MYPFTHAPRHYILIGTILALAALAIVLLLASGSGASARTTASDLAAPGSGLLPQQDEPQTEPEACATNPAEVVVMGSVALFDVYWDPETETLNNNPCPPAVVHTDHVDPDTEQTTEITTRSPSDVDIGHTVVHLRHQVARRTLVAKRDGQEVQASELAVDPDGPLWGAYPPGEENKQVWFLPVFATEEEEHAHAQELAFHLGFSAGLLRDEDWNGDILYDFEVIREPGIDPSDRGIILASRSNSFSRADVQWDTRHPDRNPVQVEPGEYVHRAWAFTKPGTYVLEVQAKGNPEDSLVADDRIDVVTSVARRYTFHVGLLADLEVEVEASDSSPAAGGEARFTITASNGGPSEAPDTVVRVELPHGLTFSSSSVGDAYDAGEWRIGDLLADASASMTLVADVGENTHGEELTVTASISATELIGDSPVTELDPHTGDNTDASTVTPARAPNSQPIFNVVRSVLENSHHSAAVGDPIPVRQADNDALHFALSGAGSEKFYVESSSAGAQIRVQGGADLDYETKSSYELTLRVADNRDLDGNENGTVENPNFDNAIGVTVNLQDVHEGPYVTVAVDLAEGTLAELTATPHDLPAGISHITYTWEAYNNTRGGYFVANNQGPDYVWQPSQAATWTLRAYIQYQDSSGRSHQIGSNRVTVTLPAS